MSVSFLLAMCVIAEAGYARPPAEDLRRIYGVRHIAEYAQPELLAVNEEEWSRPYISEDGARLFVAARSGTLQAYNIETHKSLWKRKDLGTMGHAMIESEGYLWVGSGSDWVALDQGTGREVHRIPLGGKIGGDITVTGSVALVPIRPNGMLAVDIPQNKVRWRVRRNTPDGLTVRGQAGAAVDTATGLVYLGFSDGMVMAVRLLDGKEVWSSALGVPGELFSDVDATPVLMPDGRLWAASYNGGLFMLDPQTGARLVERPLKRIIGLARSDNMVVASHGDGQVLGLNLQGQLRWRYKTQKGGAPTPPVILPKGKVAVAFSRGPLTFLEVGNGRPVQLLDAGSGISVAPFHRTPNLAIMTNEGMLWSMREGHGVGASL